MGENVLQSQVEAFKKGMDKAMSELLRKDMFVMKEVFEEEFVAEPFENYAVRESDGLIGYCSSDTNEIHLVKGHITVGKIVGDGAKAISKAISASGLPGIIPLTVSHVSQISGCFKVQHKGL